MKKLLLKIIILSNSLFIAHYSFSQTPEIEWQNTIGGTGNDILHVMIATTDGGYIAGGASASLISGDKTENVIGGNPVYNDYWVVKLDASGNIMWQNTIGGTSYDYFTCLQQTMDGGYIVGGYSRSGITGDKTEAVIGGGSTYDFWVLKLDATGNIVWQNTIGGTDDDRLKQIIQTSDGGYILGGESESEISADKSDPLIGADDLWIIKINETGILMWQKTIGGVASDRLSDIKQTPDGGYIVASYSTSGISGNKTESSNGFYDYWILKLNSIGNIIWQNTIGGINYDEARSIELTTDGGYIIGGISDSEISGDKTEDHYEGEDDDAYDIWLVKINSVGNVVWDNTIGGIGEDEMRSMKQTADNGFIIAARSYASFSGDKVESNIGEGDGWLIKLNEEGDVIWQNTIGGYSFDGIRDIDITSDGGYILGMFSRSGINGDKTEDVIGEGDYWIIKMSEDDCLLQPTYADIDLDGYGIEPPLYFACEPSAFQSMVAGDFHDLNNFIHPGYIELCDGFDNDCDGIIDEGLTGCNPGPAIEWQNTIGGIGDDFFSTVVNTSDGGYFIAGQSASGLSGDKTDEGLATDYWVLKLDISGNILWQNSIGGTAGERLYGAEQTIDGGYIIGGISYSPIGGDKSENSISSDIWVVKLNSGGDVVWENTINGSTFDELTSLSQTSDGGYIIGAYSQSVNSMDKTETCFGGYDYWIIKLNAAGNIQWQNTIGGNQDDRLQAIKQTSDGGYIIAGESSSGISVDKTEINYGSNDYWVVKLNSLGIITWQNTIGGSASDYLIDIVQSSDGGFVLGGYSSSPISGEKTVAGYGVTDYWVIKIDALGNILWQKSFGGTSHDYITSINATEENNYIIGGYSSSSLNGSKSEKLLGQTDYWIILIDDDGNAIWQNTIGAKNDDELKCITTTPDGGFILGGNSKSNIYYDKTEDGQGGDDYWIIKLTGECVAEPEICNTIDDNCNGLIDDDVIETITISAAGLTTFCQGGSVILNATTSGPNYQWKKNGTNIPGAILSSYTVTTKGTYTCETSSACDTELSTGIFVNVQKNPPASITAGGATTFCAGGSVILTANTGGGLSYKWYKDAVLIPGATSINYTATTAGFYKCNVTKTASGCNKNSNGIMVTVPCKEGEELLSNSDFTIFPNPNTGTFNVVYNVPTGATSPYGGPWGPISPLKGGPMGVTTLEIFNSLGQQIHSQQINSCDGNINETISINNLSSGIYYIRMRTNDIHYEKKLIIE